MKLQFLRKAMSVLAVGLVAPLYLGAVEVRECSVQPATPASYTWNFKAEANNLFAQFKAHNQQLMQDSEWLAAYSRWPDQVSWEIQAGRLNQARDQVNEMNSILCRLEAIRSAVTPSQAELIDQLHQDAVLAGVHLDDAIQYFDANKTKVEEFAPSAYHMQVAAVNHMSDSLEHQLNSGMAG